MQVAADTDSDLHLQVFVWISFVADVAESAFLVAWSFEWCGSHSFQNPDEGSQCAT